MIRIPAGICFEWIERYTFSGAKHINLVSKDLKRISKNIVSLFIRILRME